MGRRGHSLGKMKSSIAALGGLACAVSLACAPPRGVDRIEGEELRFTLSAGAQEALSDVPDVRGELEDVLREYFGDPRRPRYRVLESWRELGFDPNSSPLVGKRLAAEMEGVRTEDLLADNQAYWARELNAVQHGDPGRLGPWRRRPGMNRAWRELLARSDELSEGEFGLRAQSFFAERYPDLSEAASMFMPNCARCHGLEGGGDGPMAQRLFPKPRDYRAGTFKFAAVEGGAKPRRTDLLRTLVQGLPGSAMPSFRNLSLAELSGLVDYVRYLSMRGEVERMLVAEWERDEVRPAEAVEELYALVWERWLEAGEYARRVSAPAPDASPSRLALGERVYLDAQGGNCASCHGVEGRGDGPTAIRRGEDGSVYALLRDDWGDYILPRDLTSGVFRGGTRREDVYLRIHCGIPGTPMPAVGASLDAAGEPLLSEEEKWAVVDYVLSLSGRGPFAEAP